MTLMKNVLSKALTAGLVAASMFVIGCASGPPISGALYSDVQGPITATSAPRGALRGESCATSYLGLFAMGDASITAAAKMANVTQISHVEQSFTNIAFFYAQYCTIVYGNRGIAPNAPMKVPAVHPAPAPPATNGL